MRQIHCLFDRSIIVDYYVPDPENPLHYNGPRQINCPKRGDCSKCGWHPEVQAARAKIALKRRRGYINADGAPVELNHYYKGIKLK